MATIHTLADVREERELAELNAEYRRAVAAARSKVRRWERKLAQYGGEVQRETLARCRAELARLTGEAQP